MRTWRLEVVSLNVKLEKALGICDLDIQEYNGEWGVMQGDECQALQDLDNLAQSHASSSAVLHQPRDSSDDTTSPLYRMDLHIKFEAAGDQLFSDVKRVARREGLFFCSGPPKQEQRCGEKVRLKYNDDYSRLKDIRRGSIVCASIRDIVKISNALLDDPKVEVVQFHNGFNPNFDARLSAGYRDVKLIIRKEGLLWELQVEHAKFHQHKNEGGHKRYTDLRSVLERLLPKLKVAMANEAAAKMKAAM